MLHRSHSFTLASFLTLALVSSACQSATEGKGAATGKNITRAADAIQTGIGQLDATMTALTTLVNQPAAELGPQFDVFASNLDALDSTAKQVSEATAGMQEKGKAYFADWDAQIAAIQDEDIRERSAERRKTVEKELEEIRAEYEKARDTFHPLMGALQDIRKALEADLTMDGLDAVKKSVKKTNNNAADVKESLQELADSFRKVGVRMSMSGPAKAPEKK